MPSARTPRRARSGSIFLLAVVTLIAAAFAAAQPPVVFTEWIPDCVPEDDNALVTLTLQPEVGWSSVRIYFRDHEEPDWYFLEMRAEGAGEYWAALPKPEADTEKVDMRLVVQDDEGLETSGAMKIVEVKSCDADLTDEQERYADNLVVGETALAQQDEEVFGFQCEGIISRLEPDGDLRPDEACHAVLLALFPAKERLLLLVPFLWPPIEGGEPREVSPARP